MAFTTVAASEKICDDVKYPTSNVKGPLPYGSYGGTPYDHYHMQGSSCLRSTLIVGESTWHTTAT